MRVRAEPQGKGLSMLDKPLLFSLYLAHELQVHCLTTNFLLLRFIGWGSSSEEFSLLDHLRIELG